MDIIMLVMVWYGFCVCRWYDLVNLDWHSFSRVSAVSPFLIQVFIESQLASHTVSSVHCRFSPSSLRSMKHQVR